MTESIRSNRGIQSGGSRMILDQPAREVGSNSATGWIADSQLSVSSRLRILRSPGIKLVGFISGETDPVPQELFGLIVTSIASRRASPTLCVPIATFFPDIGRGLRWVQRLRNPFDGGAASGDPYQTMHGTGMLDYGYICFYSS